MARNGAVMWQRVTSLHPVSSKSRFRKARCRLIGRLGRVQNLGAEFLNHPTPSFLSEFKYLSDLFMTSYRPQLLLHITITIMATNRPEWYGIFANNPELFQNCLVALKQVDFNQDFKEHKVEAAYSNADPDTKKHVRLLDGLALLFVWARAGDVCATTFVRDNDSATIYWAKNNPSPPTLAQQTYLTELLNHFPAQKSQSEILQACMRVCRTKMITRCQKAGNQFILSPQRQNHLGVNMREPFNQDLLVRLRNARVCGQNTSLITTLDWFVTTLKDINSSIPANQLQGLLIAAYLIVPQQEEATESPILTRLQLRQVRKVAAYLAVIKRVLLTCKNHNLKSLKEKQV